MANCPGKRPETKGIAGMIIRTNGASRTTVVIQIHSRSHACVGGRGESIGVSNGLGIVLRNTKKVLLEKAHPLPFGIVIEFIHKEDIRPDSLNDLCDALDLTGCGTIRRIKITQQLPLGITIEGSIKGRDAKRGSGNRLPTP